jgi:DNA primase
LINRETIEKIFDTARIEEVIGDFVSLKRSGSNLKGLSPFTQERTPSFMVSPSKQIFKDFSSGKGGNVVSFLMEHEHLTYPEALRYLAKRYNIEIEESEQSDEEKLAESEKESMFILTQAARDFFENQLHESDEGKSVGLSYFKQRGFTEQTIKTFQLGYSPEQMDAFCKYAIDKGYQPTFLEKTGLGIQREGGRGWIDRFRGRVMFPIHNLTGRVIGFGGRILRADAKVAKYLNSPESELYHKSKVLFGMYQAKNAIVKSDNCYLVEGYTDVLSLHQSGIQNVVASSGTALTKEQIQLIKRYTPNITVLYDGDRAGINASFKGLDMILEQGMNARALVLPNGEDPDSFVRSHSTEEVEHYLATEKQDFIRFKAQVLKEDVEKDPIRKFEVIREVLTSISRIPDSIAREVYVAECARIFGIEEKTLHKELAQRRGKYLRDQSGVGADMEAAGLKVVADEVAPAQKDQSLLHAEGADEKEREIIAFLFKSGHLVKEETESGPYTYGCYVIDELASDRIAFDHPLYNSILQEYSTRCANDETLDEGFFIQHQSAEIANLAAELVLEKHELSDWPSRKIWVNSKESLVEHHAFNLVIRYKEHVVKKLLKEKADMLKENQDPERLLETLTEVNRLQQFYRIIAEKINKVV